jgi:hypothetical protein
MFAATEEYVLVGLSDVSDWHKFGVTMRPVAERLFLATPAGAPEIALAFFYFKIIRLVFWNFWSCHARTRPLNSET